MNIFNLTMARRLFCSTPKMITDNDPSRGELYVNTINEISQIISVDDLDKYVSEDIRVHNSEGSVTGIDALKHINTERMRVFQLINKLEFKDICVTEDRLVIDWIGHFLHIGEFKGVPPTFKKVTVSGLNMYRFNEAGKVVECWAAYDWLSIIQQFAKVKILP